MDFTSEQHRINFQEWRGELKEVFRFDNNVLAALYIVTAVEEIQSKFFVLDGYLLRYPEVSIPNSLLLELAIAFIENENYPSIEELLTLNEEDYQLAVQAIEGKRKGFINPYHASEGSSIIY